MKGIHSLRRLLSQHELGNVVCFVWCFFLPAVPSEKDTGVFVPFSFVGRRRVLIGKYRDVRSKAHSNV